MSEAIAIEYEPRANRFAPYSNRAELIDEICERLATGESLLSICRDAHMPNASATYAWVADDEQVAQRIARAREIGEDAIAQDALSIIDGKVPIEGMVPDATRDKARADIRLKLLAKFNPRRWGEATQIRHADANGEKLDTAPLVNDLLALMAPGALPQTDSPAPQTATYRDVTPTRVEILPPIAEVDGQATTDQTTTQGARPAYRPRATRDDVSDLV